MTVSPFKASVGTRKFKTTERAELAMVSHGYRTLQQRFVLTFCNATKVPAKMTWYTLLRIDQFRMDIHLNFCAMTLVHLAKNTVFKYPSFQII